MLSNLILLTCLNRYLLVLCYTIVTFLSNRLNASTSHRITIAQRFCFGASFKAYALRGIFAFPR